MLDYFMTRRAAVRNGEDGQTMVEYALIIALLALALVFGLSALATDISEVFTAVANAVS